MGKRRKNQAPGGEKWDENGPPVSKLFSVRFSGSGDKSGLEYPEKTIP